MTLDFDPFENFALTLSPKPTITPTQEPTPTPEPTLLTYRGIELNEAQTYCIKHALDSQYSIITGSAGSGKTTTVNALIHHMLNGNKIRPAIAGNPTLPSWLNEYIDGEAIPNYAITSFTHKALDVIRNSIDEDYRGNCFTLHKLLGFAPVVGLFPPSKKDIKNGADPTMLVEKKLFKPQAGLNSQINLDLLIIDEASMVGLETLWQHLMLSLSPRCKIVLVGDVNQLAPVMDAPILTLAMAKWGFTELTKIYRQKEGSLIDNYNKIKQGSMPTESEVWGNIVLPSNMTAASNTIVEVVRTLHKAGNWDPKQDMIIAPMKANRITALDSLNSMFRGIFNPEGKIIQIATMMGQKSFAVGDRVMPDKWSDAQEGVFNGMIGTITKITVNAQSSNSIKPMAGEVKVDMELSMDDIFEQEAKMRKAAMAKGEAKEPKSFGSQLASHTVYITFDNGVTYEVSSSSKINGLLLAWGITTYKAQGSGYRKVIVIIHSSMNRLNNNENLYTASTRAIEKVLCLYDPKGMQASLNNRTFKGKTPQEKVDWYIGKSNQIAARANMYIPTEDIVNITKWKKTIYEELRRKEGDLTV